MRPEVSQENSSLDFLEGHPIMEADPSFPDVPCPLNLFGVKGRMSPI